MDAMQYIPFMYVITHIDTGYVYLLTGKELLFSGVLHACM